MLIAGAGAVLLGTGRTASKSSTSGSPAISRPEFGNILSFKQYFNWFKKYS